MKDVKHRATPAVSHKYDLCEPVMLDALTGKPEPSSSPIMKAVLKVWAAASEEDRAAYHRFCCLNSRAVDDVERTASLCNRFKAAAEG